MTSVLGGRRRTVAFAPERVVPAPRAVAGLLADRGANLGAGGFLRATPSFATARRQPLGGIRKRCFDVLLSAAILIAVSPIMLTVAALVRLLLGGPVIFAQRRVGFDGRSFVCYKFRSMHVNGDELLKRHLAADPAAAEEWRETRKLRNDPRVNCLGNILRKSSLDELPQLFNVLRGDMSLVGPRPVVPDELAKYGRHARAYCDARPGITGLWQTSGRNSLSYRARVARDRHYVRNWSLRLDGVLLLKTIPAVLSFGQTS